MPQDVFELLTKLSSGVETKLQILFSQNTRKIINFLNYYHYYYRGFSKKKKKKN